MATKPHIHQNGVKQDTRIELPPRVEAMLIGMLTQSKDVGAIITAYAEGKNLNGDLKLSAKFYLEVVENKPVKPKGQ